MIVELFKEHIDKINDKVAERRAKVSVLESEIAAYKVEITKVVLELQKHCTHPNRAQLREYTPGSYYDRSSSTVTTSCKDCFLVLDVQTSEGGYS